MSKSTNKPFLVVFVTIFLDLLGFGILIPIRPFYAEAFGASPTVVTWLGAAYSIGQFIFVPLWGKLSDRIGRRPVILWSIAASIVGYTLFGLAGSLGMLFVSRAIAGIGNANIASAQAVIADITTPETRTRGMGMIGAAFGLGFIFGPGIGGAVGHAFGPTAPAFAAAGLGVLNLILAFFLLPETNTTREARANRRRGIAETFRVARAAGVADMLGLMLITTIAFGLMEQTVALYIEHVYVIPTLGEPAMTLNEVATGFSDQHRLATGLTSKFLVAVGVVATIVQGGLIHRLSRKYGSHRLLMVGTSIMAIGLILIPVAGAAGPFALLYGVAAVLAVGSGLYNPTITSLLSQSVPAEIQGEILGGGQSMSALGRVIAPVVAGVLFEITVDVPYFMAFAIMLVAIWLALRVNRHRPGIYQRPVHHPSSS